MGTEDVRMAENVLCMAGAEDSLRVVAAWMVSPLAQSQRVGSDE